MIIEKYIRISIKMENNISMKIKCLICGDIIESKSVHYLLTCKCESCYIDGGNYYSHIGAEDFSKIVKILDDGTEIKYNEGYIL